MKQNHKHRISVRNEPGFFESLNGKNTGLPLDASAPQSYHPLDAQARRNIKRQRKAEKRARRMESQRHMDKFSLHPITPLTENQGKSFDAFRKGKHILMHGYAGTGKTFCALYLGLENIFSEQGSNYKKLVVVRSVVPSRDMGFLPGSAMEKMRVYEEPYMEICDDLFGQGNGYNILKERGLFEFTTTSFLRGVTFTDSIVIVDEMQNMTFQELDTVMTRIGENCQIVFCGDFRQTDLDKDADKNGLHKFMDILHKLQGFEYIEFGREDIVRSSIVKDYIIARTENEDTQKKPSVAQPAMPNWAGWPPGSWPVGSPNVIINPGRGHSSVSGQAAPTGAVGTPPFLSGFTLELNKNGPILTHPDPSLLRPMTQEEINNSRTLIGD
jgi:phosphate starvation-inducible protein PhoH